MGRIGEMILNKYNLKDFMLSIIKDNEYFFVSVINKKSSNELLVEKIRFTTQDKAFNMYNALIEEYKRKDNVNDKKTA
jgi:hypothetical protein